jgi:hypothetical protein
MGERADELSDVVRRGLVRLVRERLARLPGGHLVESRLGELGLRLQLDLSETEPARSGFSRRLVAHVDELLADAVHRAAAFRPGHTWCHRCASAGCEHSWPATPRQVFAGYAPTGVPRWEDFAQLCLEQRHPDVDRLYDDPPALLTLVQAGPTLSGRMLPAFQDPAYDLVGQLVAGFFAMRKRVAEGRAVLALTIQVVAARQRGGGLALGLNLLGRSPGGEGLERLWEREAELPWRKPVRSAQAALAPLSTGSGRGAGRSRVQLERHVLRILKDLARRLERDQRARFRRTQHAEERHASGERPTSQALDDARRAPRSSLFVDEKRGTVVVVGERGRTHFFTPEGRLVSSVRYGREAIERKLKAELWRPASAGIYAAFRTRIAGG